MKNKYFVWFLPLLLTACQDTDPQQFKEKLLGGSKEERVITVGILPVEEAGGIVSNTYPGYLEEGLPGLRHARHSLA